MIQPYIRLLKAALAGSCLAPIVIIISAELSRDLSQFSTAMLVSYALVGLVGLTAIFQRYGHSVRLAVFICLLVFGLFVGLVWGGLHSGLATLISVPQLSLLAFASTVLCINGWILLNRARPAVESLSLSQGEGLDDLPERYVNFAIFIAAGLSLFLELAVIRWHTTVFEFLSFYKNFSLLACFAGLGLGYALADRRQVPLVCVIPVLTFEMGMMIFIRHGLPPLVFGRAMTSPIPEQLNMGYATSQTVWNFIAVYLYFSVIFILTALVFLPVGQLCGRLMQRRPNLQAYGFNLLGSVAGVALMLAISFLWTPPMIWFGIAFLILLSFQAIGLRSAVVASISSLAGLMILGWPVGVMAEKIYSPYQLLERTQGDNGLMMIKAAGHYYQRVHDLALTNANRKTDEEIRETANYYELPYRLHGAVRDVAVVGAGSGNDVAAALRMGVKHVDAIEIDPAILQLGTYYHPEHPYSDPRVSAIVNDARSFLRTTKQSYDMIVYGLLDSHSLLSHASSVRLDSFVYTVEGLREARSRLNENGLLSLSFATISTEQGLKMQKMMTEVFDGKPPVCIAAPYDGSVIFLELNQGQLAVPQELLKETGFREISGMYSDENLRADVSTDDWPFFYMPYRRYPVSYLGMIGLIVLLSLIIVRSFHRETPRFSQSAFFFMGAGFMLVETKGITELGLAFGNTWQVVGIVIVGILGMAYLANFLVERVKISSPYLAFVFLLLSLALGYFVAWRGGFAPTIPGRIATVAVLTCPMLFSGIVFSTILKSSNNISSVMAVNLLGAMCGGLLEYNSMYFGFRFLYLLAIGLYLLALASALITPGGKLAS